MTPDTRRQRKRAGGEGGTEGKQEEGARKCERNSGGKDKEKENGIKSEVEGCSRRM